MAFGRPSGVDRVLAVMWEDPEAWHFVLDIGRKAGLSGGSLYPAMARLDEDGVVEDRWEEIDPPEPPRPRRHLYRLKRDHWPKAQAAAERCEGFDAAGLTPGFALAMFDPGADVERVSSWAARVRLVQRAVAIARTAGADADELYDVAAHEGFDRAQFDALLVDPLGDVGQ